ncbi:MAG: hypothetical protein GY801_16605 [bacterium]|nr:hypothetical protein [bacterium]
MTDEKLTKQTHDPLLAFFPAMMLSMTFYCLVAISALFVVLWPWGKDSAHFIRQHQGPSLSFPLFTAVAILYSYIQLRCGRGELLQRSHYFSPTVIQEQEQIFFRHGLLMLLLHTAFFLLPFLPLLIVAATVSGLSQQVLIQAIGLLYTSALLFRIGGLLLYRLWGAASTLGYFVGRTFFGMFFFMLPIYLPYLSPLRVLHALHKNTHYIDEKMPLQTAYWLCLGMMCAMTIITRFAGNFAHARIKQKDAEE